MPQVGGWGLQLIGALRVEIFVPFVLGLATGCFLSWIHGFKTVMPYCLRYRYQTGNEV